MHIFAGAGSKSLFDDENGNGTGKQTAGESTSGIITNVNNESNQIPE